MALTTTPGTVYRENHHDGGHSIWVRAVNGTSEHGRSYREPHWLCVWSSLTGQCGQTATTGHLQAIGAFLVGAVPGTPAAVSDTGMGGCVADPVRTGAQ